MEYTIVVFAKEYRVGYVSSVNIKSCSVGVTQYLGYAKKYKSESACIEEINKLSRLNTSLSFRMIQGQWDLLSLR